MRKLLLLIVSIAGNVSLVNQAAHAAEVYSPPPAKISGATNGVPPSDAIILFDGSNLDAWHSVNGEQQADWTIADGVVTVKNGAGFYQDETGFRGYATAY